MEEGEGNLEIKGRNEQKECSRGNRGNVVNKYYKVGNMRKSQGGWVLPCSSSSSCIFNQARSLFSSFLLFQSELKQESGQKTRQRLDRGEKGKTLDGNERERDLERSREREIELKIQGKVVNCDESEGQASFVDDGESSILDEGMMAFDGSNLALSDLGFWRRVCLKDTWKDKGPSSVSSSRHDVFLFNVISSLFRVLRYEFLYEEASRAWPMNFQGRMSILIKISNKWASCRRYWKTKSRIHKTDDFKDDLKQTRACSRRKWARCNVGSSCLLNL
ncbi:hypothetical protein H6P81_001149 [Aristolochia fimbriata]|uniref:Uncharacterized protein n=1 Tax=Aristolochia fimbriata TaxID=158543 RepID=A0AAV7F992_ARIFI|nr:hypothetical protein H6P81_001149 [Aristolochia fimbriata]